MLERVKKNIINLRGKRLGKRVLVLESDDWGSIRIPNKDVQNELLSKQLINASDPFSMFDALETTDDLDALFNVLIRFKDQLGNHPVITANTVVANPDFTQIKANGFQEYVYEKFTDTYSRLNSRDTFDCFAKGMQAGLFHPQFHAREHVNVPEWMSLLNNGKAAFLEAFQLNCFSIPYHSPINKRNNLMATYDYNSLENLVYIQKSISEGLDLFEEIFKFKSMTTIAPCYVWNDAIEDVFFNHNVAAFQGSKFQNIPSLDSKEYRKSMHYNGEKNKNGQYYFIRNGLFEPSLVNIDWVSRCLESISIAFYWNKPAVIGTHRLNYIGSLRETNRAKNLKLLEVLLAEVLKKWPDVLFLNSEELVNAYN